MLREIETAEAMRNLDEIVTTPGLDGVYIGPAGLTIG
nr:aldolase/citrate lyase family protein [Mesorhizobium loti]